MFVQIELIIGRKVTYRRLAHRAAAEFRIVQLNVWDRLKAVANVDGDIFPRNQSSNTALAIYNVTSRDSRSTAKSSTFQPFAVSR